MDPNHLTPKDIHDLIDRAGKDVLLRAKGAVPKPTDVRAAQEAKQQELIVTVLRQIEKYGDLESRRIAKAVLQPI